MSTPIALVGHHPDGSKRLLWLGAAGVTFDAQREDFVHACQRAVEEGCFGVSIYRETDFIPDARGTLRHLKRTTRPKTGRHTQSQGTTAVPQDRRSRQPALVRCQFVR